MEDRKYRLNSASSQRAVNEDTFDKINLESKTAILPIGDVSKVVNSGEQFNIERQNSTFYRITSSLNTLFNNVLFNITGSNSWSTFNSNTIRDPEDLTFTEAIDKHLNEINGWFGFYDPNSAICSWKDMEPNREVFSMTPKNSTKNWEITITYPTKFGKMEGDYLHPVVNGGLLLIEVFKTVIGGRNMLTLATPVKHNLSNGDTVDLSGLLISDGSSTQSPNNGKYTVIRLGKDNGDKKDHYFSVDIEDLVSINSNSRMSKIINGRKSRYYLRVFTKIKTRVNNVVENDDYEIYPLAFSQTIYEDKTTQFVFNEDIDVSGLKDNLGRPLSEIYITMIKTKRSQNTKNATFTDIKSGIKIPFFGGVATNLGISDINRITNHLPTSHIPLNDDVVIDDDTFYGDVVEYNDFELKEVTLGDVYHRFNTRNREGNQTIDGNPLGPRYEGYVYKPHHKIKIREFSNYIEQGVYTTLNKPSYASYLNDGRYIWRDLLDIGLNNSQETSLDYPFLNGTHYINTNIITPLLRQDPFGFYGLQWTEFPADASGTLLGDNIIPKNPQDVC